MKFTFWSERLSLRQLFSQSSKLGAGIIAFSLVLSVAWLIYTGYISDDAYITFRYARQLAEGNGFVYNIGERVYGTTTPLFTFLLAGWFWLTHIDLAMGAQIFDVLSFSSALVVLWLGLRKSGATHLQQIVVLVLVGNSPRLWHLNTQGMETPIVLLLMASSWYAIATKRITLAGFLAGCLLWTRIDSALWLLALLPSLFLVRPRDILPFVVSAAFTYLPWLVFATIYFGSPIPHTATAKWVAYSINSPPFLFHLAKIARYLSPIDLPADMEPIAPVLASITIALAAWGSLRSIKQKDLLVFPVFIFLDVVSLTLTRTTYFNRYFVPILWATLILAGLALGHVFERIAQSLRRLRLLTIPLVTGLITLFVIATVLQATDLRDSQFYRNESSLRAIGLWLASHTPSDSVVLLEPLGYIGFFSNRTMIDEVGLVTPRVVELKREGVSGPHYALEFQPDLVIFHCDGTIYFDGLPQSHGGGESLAYSRKVTFDPLGFDTESSQGAIDKPGLAWSSCYTLFQRTLP